MSRPRRRKLPTGTILRRRRTKLQAQLRTVTAEVRRGKDARQEIRKLRASIGGLEQQVKSERQGAWRAVSAGLGQLDASLAKLAQAESATSAERRTELLAAGLRALGDAYRSAKHAGHDWTL